MEPARATAPNNDLGRNLSRLPSVHPIVLGRAGFMAPPKVLVAGKLCNQFNLSQGR